MEKRLKKLNMHPNSYHFFKQKSDNLIDVKQDITKRLV